MSTSFNVYFAGQLLEGQQLADVREKLAKLFNADQQTLDRLFSGKAQLLKRDCDEATALKYKQAMERAGAAPIVRRSQDSRVSGQSDAAQPTAPGPATAAPAATEDATPPMTAAQRIAALAATPDENPFPSDEAGAGAAVRKPPPSDPDAPELAPAGSDLLLPGERSHPVAPVVDTSALEIGQPTERLSPPPPTPPPAPDTAHLDMGAAGELIPGLPAEPPPPVPDSTDMDLAPVGEDIGTLGPAANPVPTPDLSGIDLAPAGSEVLEEKYRHHDVAEAPITDHLSLQE